MKKILIIYPHFPPSNLAGVHRPRLFAQHLPAFGWEPVILTVHEKYYEEAPDWNLLKLLPTGLRIEKVHALPLVKPRLIGDIGLRAFRALYKKAKQLIANESIDFVYIPIPSFYCALIGRWLNHSTKIKYGIDYIDPWVHQFPGSENLFSRHWLSSRLAAILEPISVKKASLITGVAEGYYSAVLKRNPHLKKQAVCGAMPYGGEEEDHKMADKLHLEAYLFKKKTGKIQMVYAGAMLPKAYAPLEAIFKSISAQPALFSNIEFHFIGTGKTSNDPIGYNIKPLAIKYGLWNTIVFEYPQRIPYLDVLAHLNHADGIFILGSTEAHYTPSKSYQGVLSGKPVFAVLHQASTAAEVLVRSRAGIVLQFNGETEMEKIIQTFPIAFAGYIDWMKKFNPDEINRQEFEQYSAKNVTKKLAALLNSVVK